MALFSCCRLRMAAAASVGLASRQAARSLSSAVFTAGLFSILAASSLARVSCFSVLSSMVCSWACSSLSASCMASRRLLALRSSVSIRSCFFPQAVTSGLASSLAAALRSSSWSSGMLSQYALSSVE